MSQQTLIKSVMVGTACTNYRIAKFDASGNLAPATAATDALAGVVCDGGGVGSVLPVGEVADVAKLGVFSVEAGAAFSEGAPLTTDADGRAIKATTAGSRVIGFAEAAATAAGQVVDYLAAPCVL